MLEARQGLPPPRLAGSSEKKSFDLKGDARDIFENVAGAYGLLVVFESDYQSPPHFTFRMTDAGYEEALRALETVANSFLVPVNDRLALVMRDTPQKRTERSQTMSAAFPIPERMSVQDAQEMMAAVQQTLDIRRVVTDPTRHVVFMRDQAAKVIAARQMFYNLSRLRPQIAVDVELLTVDKTSSLNYGISLPNELSVVNFQGAMSLPNALRAIEHLTGFATPFALGITQATAFATLARSSATTLLESQIVSLDGQAATLHVGERYPIATNQYIGNTSGVGQVFTPPPTVNFEDLGLVLKVTPSVNEDHDVTLDVDADFKELGAASAVSGLPIIVNRKYAGKSSPQGRRVGGDCRISADAPDGIANRNSGSDANSFSGKAVQPESERERFLRAAIGLEAAPDDAGAVGHRFSNHLGGHRNAAPYGVLIAFQ